MLENIKLLLGYEDNSKDQLILYYINKLTIDILNYCKLEELNQSLESFIEDKVFSIMQSKKEQSNIKAVTRGDTKIEYNVTTIASDSVILTVLDKNFLNQFRKMRFV